jgi:hypothetical protein
MHRSRRVEFLTLCTVCVLLPMQDLLVQTSKHSMIIELLSRFIGLTNRGAT